MIPITLIVVGLILIFASKGIARLIYDQQIKVFGILIGNIFKSNEALILKVYRVAVIAGGVLALFGAYGVAFGPIYI